MPAAVKLKSASGLPRPNPVNLGVLGLGGHPLQSLGTFYNGVKKLEHFEFGQLLTGSDFGLFLPILSGLDYFGV